MKDEKVKIRFNENDFRAIRASRIPGKNNIYLALPANYRLAIAAHCNEMLEAIEKREKDETYNRNSSK